MSADRKKKQGEQAPSTASERAERRQAKKNVRLAIEQGWDAKLARRMFGYSPAR